MAGEIYAVPGETMSAIANAIRSKTGSDDFMTAASMASAIEGISGEGGVATGTKELLCVYENDSLLNLNSVSFDADNYPGYYGYVATIDVTASVSDWLYINNTYFGNNSKVNANSLLIFLIDGVWCQCTSSVTFVETRNKIVKIHWYASSTTFNSGSIKIYGLK